MEGKKVSAASASAERHSHSVGKEIEILRSRLSQLNLQIRRDDLEIPESIEQIGFGFSCFLSC